MPTKVILFFLLITSLLFLTQVSKFTNKISISRSGQEFSIDIDGQVIKAEFETGDMQGVSFISQQSMWGESGVNFFSVKTAESEKVYYDKSTLYLFGYDLHGGLLHGGVDNFRKSFGDWYNNLILSKKVEFADIALPEGFTLRIEFTGRGEKRVLIGKNEELSIVRADGFLSNRTSICYLQKCINKLETDESIGQNLLRIGNFFIELLLFALLAYGILTLFKSNSLSEGSFDIGNGVSCIFLGISICIHLYFVIYFSGILGWIPHIPDSATFYRLAKLLTYGDLKFTPGIKPVEAFTTAGSYVSGESIYYFYNHFWPALIAIFMLFGLEPLLNPGLSAINIILIFIISKRLFSPAVAALAALFYSLSPLSIILAADYMNHTVTVTVFLVAVILLSNFKDRPRPIPAVLCGVLTAYALILRPVTAIALAVPTALYFVFQLKENLRTFIIYSAIGFLPLIMLYFLDNYLTSGSFLSHPYITVNKGGYSLSKLAQGLNSRESTLGFLVTSTQSSFYSRLFLALPLLALFKPSKRRIMLYSIFLSLIVFYLPYAAHGLHGYGARYFYEALPGLFILAALAISDYLSQNRLSKLLYFGIAFITLVSSSYNLKQRLGHYKNYNNISDGLFNELKKLPQGSIIITAGSPWQSLEQGVAIFDPKLSDNIFIRPLPGDKHMEVVNQFPERPVYKLTSKIEKIR